MQIQSVSQEVKVISDIQDNFVRAILPENVLKKRKMAKKDHTQKKVKGSQKHTKASYHWSQYEQKKYLNYIIENRRRFEMPVRQKKLKKIHSRLSECIYSRNATQCRTHHQKLLAKWGSIDGIIIAFRKLVAKRNVKRIAHLDEHERICQQQVKEEHIQKIAPYEIIQSSNHVKEEDSQHELYQGRTHEDHTGKSSSLETTMNKQQVNDKNPTELTGSKQEAMRQQDQVNGSTLLHHYQAYPINLSWNPYHIFWFYPNTHNDF